MKLSRRDRQALLGFIGEKKTARLSSEQILDRAASLPPSKEKEFEQAETTHKIYNLPPVSTEVIKELYSRISKNQDPDSVGYVAMEYATTPEATKTNWSSTRVRQVSEYYDTEDDVDSDIMDVYDIAEVYGYTFTFIR